MASVNTQELFDILGINLTKTKGEYSGELGNLVLDSRKVVEGDIFIALKGSQADGHQFIEKALDNGAKVIMCSREDTIIRQGVAYAIVNNLEQDLGRIAQTYYGTIDTEMKVVGVTGTNGKSTVVTLLYQLFEALGYRCGLISTVKIMIGQQEQAATHTTPDAIELAKIMRQMEEAGCTHVFMEVSSHGVAQGRINGVTFSGGVFTNITHDHLDYHGTMDAYIKAKKGFFDRLDAGSFALINVDDRNGRIMVQNTSAKVKTYAVKTMADIHGQVISDSVQGLHLKIDGAEVYCRLMGLFNAYNLLAAYGVAMALDEEPQDVLPVLSMLKGAEGRMELVTVDSTNRIGVVDYAHTPDALENVLMTLKSTKHRGQKVYTVIGCGGDRDTSKRPLMAQVAVKYSDLTILTSDNPRSEDPESILDMMEAGLADRQDAKYLRIADRASAIKTAVMMSSEGDILLIAGKGHEKYQDVKGVKHPFDDVEVLSACLQKA